MKRTSLLIIVLLLFSFLLAPAVKAESGPWWVKTYGGSEDDKAFAVAVADNGDVIVAGYTKSFGAGKEDVWVVRLEENGNVKWQKTYGGSSYDVATAIAIAPNGDVIVAGRTWSFGAGWKDVWVLRLDANGNVKWQKTYGGEWNDYAEAVAVADNGDVIVAGYTDSFDAGGVWVLRLDANGNVKWQKTYGGSDLDEAKAVAVAPNGDVIVAGRTWSFGAGNGDVWVLRLDANGNVKWQKTYGGSDLDEAKAVAVAPNGDVIVAGYTKSFGAGEDDFWVLRLDGQGNVKWQKTYGGSYDDRAFAVALASNGDIIVAGYDLLRLSPDGELKWAVELGGNDIKILSDGTAVLAGSYNLDFLVARFNVDEVPSYSGWKYWEEKSFEIHDSDAEVQTTNAQVKTSNAEIHSTNAEIHSTNTEVETLWAMSTLKVTSDPSGAKAYVDGDYKGETPLTLELSQGTHTVKLTKEDYEDYTKTIEIKPGETTTLSATLTPKFGYLTVYSSPSGAEVYVDGDYIGTTPLEGYRLSPGEHEVEIKKEGYKDYTKTVSITAGEKKTLSASLVLLSPPTSSTTTTSPTSDSETSQAQGPGGSNFNPMYIAGALIGLLLIGGIAAKAKGGKSKEKARSAKAKAEEKPKPVQKVKAEPGKPAQAPAETKKPEEPAVPARKPAHQEPVSGFPSVLLSRYEPLGFIGEGGFAKVFKVTRKKDGKIVALKIPRIDERTSKTFIKEVSTWLHLDHPNIVRLYDVDILPIPYLEMEYVEGTELDGKVIRDLGKYPKPVDEKTALKLIRGIAEGLKHAHSKGIYHRDLKPLNILLKADLTPKITDWGLAKLETMSSSRSVMGYTPLYAAPEHLMPSKYGHTDERTDIWQLGVTFYELLTGRLPFEGYTYEEVFGKIVDEGYRFTPPSKVNPALAKYDGIFEKLLAKRKEERYQSVDEFLKDLEKLREVEKRKEELEKDVEELKKSLAKSMEDLRRSRSAEEIVRNRRMVVETLGKLALAYAELNRKAELLNTLNDLKFYTMRNLPDLTSAISTVEMLIREDLPVSRDFTERLKVLVHNIKRENGV